MVTRYAIVRGAQDRIQVESFLPDNYAVVAEITERGTEPGFRMWKLGTEEWGSRVFVIAGRDTADVWLHRDVRGALATSFITCEEIDLSHKIMRLIPINA